MTETTASEYTPFRDRKIKSREFWMDPIKVDPAFGEKITPSETGIGYFILFLIALLLGHSPFQRDFVTVTR